MGMEVQKAVTFFLAACSFLFAIEVSKAEEIQWFPYPNTGVNLGQGFDLLTGAPTPASCIEFDANYDDGLDTAVSFTEINSFVDTMSSMKISGSGKLKLALLEASANLSLANDSKVTQSFKDVGVNARVFLGASYVGPTKDQKYRPDSENSAAVSDVEEPGSRPAITFTDMALDEWPGLGNAVTGDEVSAYTICGSGYVSTIISGVELNAILSTEDSSYDDSAKFSGDLKAKILGGLATIQASADGTSEANTEFKSIKVNARITGKSKYQIPLNGETLQTFIRDLPKDLEGNARPILIAVTPYGNLFPDVAGAYATASDFSVLVDSWFIAREARARTLEIIRNYGNRNVTTRSHFLEKSRMHRLVEEAYELEDEIQRELRSLVAKEQKANIVITKSEGAANNSSRTIFSDMIAAKTARDNRLTAERQAVVNLIDRGTLTKIKDLLEDQPESSNTKSLSEISKRINKSLSIESPNDDLYPQNTNTENAHNVSNANKEEKPFENQVSRIQNLSRAATDLYLAALLSVGGGKIDLDYLLTASEKRGFELALRVLIRGNDGVAQDIKGIADPELFSDVARLLDERDQCIRDAGRQYLDARQQSAVLNGSSILEATAQKIRKAYDDRIQVCITTYEQRFSEVVEGNNAVNLTSESADNDVRYLSRSLFIDVVARHVYEEQFLPIKNSACDSDPKSGFCSVDSLVVRDVINDLIVADTEYVTARAQPLFGFEIDGNQAVPVDDLKEIKRLPKPNRPNFGLNCGGIDGIICP